MQGFREPCIYFACFKFIGSFFIFPCGGISNCYSRQVPIPGFIRALNINPQFSIFFFLQDLSLFCPVWKHYYCFWRLLLPQLQLPHTYIKLLISSLFFFSCHPPHNYLYYEVGQIIIICRIFNLSINAYIILICKLY